MNRRTMLLGSIGAVVGAALPVVANVMTLTTAGKSTSWVVTDPKVIAAFHRMHAAQVKLTAMIKQIKAQLKRAS